jgi:hypothetical protein
MMNLLKGGLVVGGKSGLRVQNKNHEPVVIVLFFFTIAIDGNKKIAETPPTSARDE